MLKTLLATSAVASMLAVSAYAQNAPAADAQPTPPEVQVPADPGSPDAGTPIVPDSAQDVAPGIAPAQDDNMAAEPAAPAEGDNLAAEPAPADNMAAEPAAPPPADGLAAEPTLEEGWSKVDTATLSADQLIGAKIRTFDQSDIAEVQDVLFSADNQLDHVVARFGGFLGFGETMVLLDPSEVTVVKDPNGTMYVLTQLSPDELKGRPAYEAPEKEAPLNAAPGNG
jgi:hypothetical protein